MKVTLPNGLCLSEPSLAVGINQLEKIADSVGLGYHPRKAQPGRAFEVGESLFFGYHLDCGHP